MGTRTDTRWDGQGSPAAPALGTEGIRPPSCVLPTAVLGKGRAPYPAWDTSKGPGAAELQPHCIQAQLHTEPSSPSSSLQPRTPPPSPPLPAPCLHPACIAASPRVPRWAAPQYSHGGNAGAGAKPQAQRVGTWPGGTSRCHEDDDFGVDGQGCVKAACQWAEPAPGLSPHRCPFPAPGRGSGSRPQASQALSHAANL